MTKARNLADLLNADGQIDNADIADNTISNAKLAQTPNFRNIIINGDMSIAQRSTSVASITATGYYTADRFQTAISNLGTWTQSQSTDVPTGQGFAKSLKVDCTTADATPSPNDVLSLTQKFEGQNLQYLKKGTANAVSLTASFWVKSTKTGTFICELRDTDNNRAISKSYTVAVTNTWEKKTITFEGDTTGAFNNDNGNSLDLNFYLGAGTTYTSGTLQTTWGLRVNANRAVGQVNIADSTYNDFYLTGVQLEAGTTASDFEFLPVDVNLNRCQRYYEKSYSYATAPGTNTYVGATRFSGSTDGSSNMVVTIEYATQKRATATQTYYTPSGTSGSWDIARSGSSSTVTANNWNNNETRQNAYFTFGASHNYATGYAEGQWVADAEL